MTRAARDAHLRLLSSLPRRTHEWRPITREWGYKRTPSDEQMLKAKLAEMRARGATNKQMRLDYGCTNSTITKLIGTKREPIGT